MRLDSSDPFGQLHVSLDDGEEGRTVLLLQRAWFCAWGRVSDRRFTDRGFSWRGVPHLASDDGIWYVHADPDGARLMMELFRLSCHWSAEAWHWACGMAREGESEK